MTNLPDNKKIIDSQAGKTLRHCTSYAVFAYFPSERKWAVYTRHTNEINLVTELRIFDDQPTARKAYSQRKAECLRA